MDILSEDSDIDGLLTPIESPQHMSHGHFIESDSVSELFFLEKEKPKSKLAKLKPKQKPEAVRPKKPSSASTRHARHRSPSNEPPEDGVEMKAIYKELQAISDKLKRENHMLYEREQKVKERERLVDISQTNIKTISDHQVRQRLQSIEKEHKEELERLESIIKEKCRENKRLKDSFETLKQANDALRKEMDILQQGYDKLEKQAVTSQSRLINLQRKHEFEQRQSKEKIIPALDSSVTKLGSSKAKDSEDSIKKSTKASKSSSPVLETMSVLLDWVSDVHLRQTVTEQPTQPSEQLSEPDYIQEKITRVLPSLVELLKEYNLTNLRVSLPCLQFIYWSLVHIEKTQTTTKSNMVSTLRRLGEEIYKPRSSNRTVESSDSSLTDYKTSDRKHDGLFFHSCNSHLRFLSSLIILKTLSQADVLAIVFDTIKVDLKSDVVKELFLYYQATPVITAYLKPVNKIFLGQSVDIFIQMSSDSPFASSFLESCGNESWFRTIAMVLRTPIQENRIMDCISILLQKLSKIKSNKKFFEVYTITSILQEILRNCGQDNAFLALNLKSILFNLNCSSK